MLMFRKTKQTKTSTPTTPEAHPKIQKKYTPKNTKTHKTHKNAQKHNHKKTQKHNIKTHKKKKHGFSLVTPNVGLGQQSPKGGEPLLHQEPQVLRGVERIASATLAAGRCMGPAQGRQELVGHGSRRHGLALRTSGRH